MTVPSGTTIKKIMCTVKPIRVCIVPRSMISVRISHFSDHIIITSSPSPSSLTCSWSGTQASVLVRQEEEASGGGSYSSHCCSSGSRGSRR